MCPKAVPRLTCVLGLALLGCGGESSPGTGPGPTVGRVDATAIGAAPDAATDLPTDQPGDPDAGADGAGADLAPDGPPPPSAVVLSEVMYHPVLEDDYEEQHEFVELHNRGVAPVDFWAAGVWAVTSTSPSRRAANWRRALTSWWRRTGRR